MRHNRLARLLASISLTAALVGCQPSSDVPPSEDLFTMETHRVRGPQMSAWVSVWRDPNRPVTCWILRDGGISCLPNASFDEAQTPDVLRGYPR